MNLSRFFSTLQAWYIRDRPILTTYEGLFTSFCSFMYVSSVSMNLTPSTILAHMRQLPHIQVIAADATFAHVLAVFSRLSVLP